MQYIFETNHLTVRKLAPSDLAAFHEMQGNLNVMRYTTGRAMTLEEDRADLHRVIDLYDQPDNDFWVWAIVQKTNGQFVGTCALIKNDQGEREIGYRFLERFWGRGYGKEITRALIAFALGLPNVEELVAYVDKNNVPSVKILDATFRFVKEYYNEEEGCTDRYYKVTSRDLSGLG